MQSISISHRHECLNKRDAKSPSSHSMFEAGRMMAEIVIATRSRCYCLRATRRDNYHYLVAC
jgi:hypothetical protein